MDLGTVKRRIGQGSYATPEHAWAEICLVRSAGQALCGGDCDMESTPGVLEMQGLGYDGDQQASRAQSHPAQGSHCCFDGCRPSGERPQAHGSCTDNLG